MPSDPLIGIVLPAMWPERSALLAVLGSLDATEWQRPTECPAYTVHGIACHLLGDDLSLLSRQRDGSRSGLFDVAADMPGADFRSILDAFNDGWVRATRFMSPRVLVDLLSVTGEWTARWYGTADPEGPGEYVPAFGGPGPTSPAWHAAAREFLERWTHQAQIRRALGRPSNEDTALLVAGAAVAARLAGWTAQAPSTPGGSWRIGAVDLGPADRAADVLTRAHPAEEVRRLVRGPAAEVDVVARLAGRP